MDLYTLDLTAEGLATLTSVVGLLGITLLSGSEKKEKRILILLFIVFLFIPLSNGLFRLFNGNVGTNYLTVVFRSIAFLAGIWFLAFTNKYIYILVRRDKKEKKAFYASVFSIAGIATVILIFNIFTGFLYKTNSEGNLVRGKAFYLVAIAEGIIWLFDVVSLVLNKKELSKQD